VQAHKAAEAELVEGGRRLALLSIRASVSSAETKKGRHRRPFSVVLTVRSY
jgi:hypothetical protein